MIEINDLSKEQKIQLINNINEMQKAIFHFQKRSGREPSNKELSEILNKPEEKIQELKDIIEKLEKDFENEMKKSEIVPGINRFCDYSSSNEIKIENQKEYEELKELIQKSNSILKEREKEVLFLRFGIETDYNWTLKEIGKKLNISISMVRTSIVKGLNMITRVDKKSEK